MISNDELLSFQRVGITDVKSVEKSKVHAFFTPSVVSKNTSPSTSNKYLNPSLLFSLTMKGADMNCFTW